MDPPSVWLPPPDPPLLSPPPPLYNLLPTYFLFKRMNVVFKSI
ncbi:hypothetical protein [Clostridium sp. ZBS17]|nr:hypothetical protein [Clostridium sp. ZBS17]